MSVFTDVVEGNLNFNFGIQMFLRTVQDFQENCGQTGIDRWLSRPHRALALGGGVERVTRALRLGSFGLRAVGPGARTLRFVATTWRVRGCGPPPDPFHLAAWALLLAAAGPPCRALPDRAVGIGRRDAAGSPSPP
jgi:hypothetical protein